MQSYLAHCYNMNTTYKLTFFLFINRKPEVAAEQSTVPSISATIVVPPRPPLKETVQVVPAASNVTTSKFFSFT